MLTAHSGLTGLGWVLLGPRSQCMAGWGQQVELQWDLLGVDMERASLSLEGDCFQEHSSVAGSLSDPQSPLAPNTTLAPALPQA